MEIKITYKYDKDYKIMPASGCWGGLNGNGDIVCDFFVEYRKTPDEITLNVEGEKADEDISKRTGEAIIRSVLASVMLRPDVAFNMGKWLMEKSKEAGFVGEGMNA